MVDLVSPELLPETFWVNLVDPQQSDLIFEAISGLPGVESVIDQRSYLDQIFALLNAGSLTAVAVASLMLLAAALLIATTIRLSAFSRRRELAIMRLVGASNRFIQTPFVLEGLVAATLGAALASAAVWGIVSRELVETLLKAGREVTYLEVEADQGHDAFLMPIPRYINAMRGFLDNAYEELVNDAS